MQIYHTELGSDAQNASGHALLDSADSSPASAGDDAAQHSRWTMGRNLRVGLAHRYVALCLFYSTMCLGRGCGCVDNSHTTGSVGLRSRCACCVNFG
jgi:hypothetical protein